MPPFNKLAPFLDDLQGQDAEFRATLDAVLTAQPGPIKNWMDDNLPNAITWDKEIRAAMLFTQTPELATLPKVREVLLFLSRIKSPKPPPSSDQPPPDSSPDLSDIAELKKAAQ